VCVRTAWPSVQTVFTEILSAFEQNFGVIWIAVYRLEMLPSRPDGLQIMNIVRTWCRVIRTEYWNFQIHVDFWEQTSCRILIDRASGRCGFDVRTSSMFIYRTLRGVQTPSKARPDGVALTSGRRQCLSIGHCGASRHLQRPVRMVAQEPVQLTWFLHRTLHG